MIDMDKFYENRKPRKLDNENLQEGEICVLVKDANHGDMKTRMAKPDEYPTLPEGTVVEFVKEWTNFYGKWFRVVTYWGQTYDLPPNSLERQHYKV